MESSDYIIDVLVLEGRKTKKICPISKIELDGAMDVVGGDIPKYPRCGTTEDTWVVKDTVKLQIVQYLELIKPPQFEFENYAKFQNALEGVMQM